MLQKESAADKDQIPDFQQTMLDFSNIKLLKNYLWNKILSPKYY